MTRIGSRSTGRPTLNEVARQAGVSPITASRALRGVSTVTPESVERVRAAALDLGYVANPAARALASSQSQTVVVLVPSLSNQLFIETLEAIQNVLRTRGLDVVIGNYHYSPEEEENLLRNHLVNRPRGLLLTGFDHTPALRQLLAASGVPCVHMMELDTVRGAYCVGFSQIQAGAEAARHLLGRGRKRLAYIAAQLDPRVMQRGEGFRQVLEEQGLYDPALQVMTPQPSSIGLGGELFMQLMTQHPDVDGVFFCNDDLAQGAALEALRRGIEIPRRVSLVGFNDLPGSAHMVPRLTSIRTPREEVGQRAAQLLLGLIDGVAQKPQVDLGFELVVRESS
ncbi:Gluconate utilization system GNT-I transcriptional repressor [Pseudomonas savastanoi pv. glycinea]|uniref:LacI family DNA-binding transcriptional regulator n=1 Tax=Pseudomonas TaxID=286 RepID=UPI000C0875CC|nr:MULTISPECIES: LacI family DNA-binding transcriptional regulator [Pseudomonas]MCD5973996.1 LacI family DNA-binding transcriptional regulator [Pseudomonas quasicaspiana]PHN27555.1 LacI family transcriptional regulator [Pseudomonas sp. ICMP 561]RMR01253.1 Gluconate utilization system GNT-I transcriptional repressor [Pseudomonas savastanoi pv. glycinea]